VGLQKTEIRLSAAATPSATSAVSPQLLALQRVLERNRFGAHVAANRQEAVRIVLERILPTLAVRRYSYGGSMTVSAMKPALFPALAARGLERVDTHEPGVPWPEIAERRRQALLTDLFFTGTNAITAQGQLVNLDAYGNRVGGLTFGPHHVVVFASRNKLAPDLAAAMHRVKHVVAPANAARLDFDTPCRRAGRCVDCASPDRICNVWTITERAHPAGRIHVVLIDEDLGL
jgi:hypothetical protein